MLFASTRNTLHQVGFSAALTRGLADDGGLYVPTDWPALEPHSEPDDLAALASELLRPLVAGDPLEAELDAICREAFNFPAPLQLLDDSRRLSVLELFHGPTAAFKDFGARFLAAALERSWPSAAPRGAARPLKILVATSGDTGGAVAAAFHRHAGIEVAVISGRQSAAVSQRCLELGIRHVQQGIEDKGAALGQLLARLGIKDAQCACIGDDEPDVPMLRRVGLAVAVADAHPTARAVAHRRTRLAGGAGAVREVCDWLLAARAAPKS